MIVAALATILVATPHAFAFQLEGHEVIEAAAYKRLLALDVVPGTTVSGRALLATLIATGVLAAPPCFDRNHLRGDCGGTQRLELPLQYWPLVRSGTPDLVIDRQLGQRGQCQHFMARTSDGLSPVDPRFGAPRDLATTAYSRCIRIAGVVFDGILRDPYLAAWRLAGTYVLMHAIEDSFSAAHANRDAQFKVVHLLSWTLLDWPRYAMHGGGRLSAPTHHAVTDHRDDDYVRWDARTLEGRACRDFHNPYAYPEECLTERAQAAVAAIVDYLVVIYRIRERASAQGKQASLFESSSSSADDASLWLGYLRAHISSVAAPVELPTESQSPLPRPDVFFGAQGVGGRHALGAGLWTTRLFYGPALPFALGVSATAGYVRDDGVDQLGASASLSLVLPLLRRFSIGAAPAGVRLACDPRFQRCVADVVAQLGVLLVPLGDSGWLGVEGPRWSWTERAIGTSWFGLALGWSHERGSHPEPVSADAVATWDPPRPDEVRAYRSARSTRVVYLATTVASGRDRSFGGVGFDWQRDRDPWDRRAGFAPELQVEVDTGATADERRGGAVALAPMLRAYVLPNRLALTAAPALVRVGLSEGSTVTLDVGGRAGIVLEVGRLELAVDSPPLSYVSTARWHALPFTVRLGLRID